MKRISKDDRIFIAGANGMAGQAIKRNFKKNGYKFIMTSKSCLTGTDRVAEASKKIKSNIIQ